VKIGDGFKFGIGFWIATALLGTVWLVVMLVIGLAIGAAIM